MCSLKLARNGIYFTYMYTCTCTHATINTINNYGIKVTVIIQIKSKIITTQ